MNDLINRFAAGQITRRQLMKRAAALGVSTSALAAALPGTSLAAPSSTARPAARLSQTAADQLVVVDNLQGFGWLYLDPGKFFEINSTSALVLCYESLYAVPDPKDLTSFAPLLAKDMPQLSADGLTATIPLRDDVTFHNSGNPMTADDVVFSAQRLGNLKGNPSFIFNDFFDKVEAVDPHTVKFTLKAPNAALIAILSCVFWGVLDSKVAQEHGGLSGPDAADKDKLTDWFNQGNSCGTGPYRLTTWDKANAVTLDASDKYWGEAPNFTQIIYRNVADTNTQLQLLESGEADIAFIVDPDNYERVKSNPGLQVLEGNSLALQYVALNCDPAVGGPLSKKEARQAIAYSLDYDGVINDLLAGGAVRPAAPIPLGLLGADDVKDLAYKQDLAKAQQLWDASGAGETEITLTYGAGQITPAGLTHDVLATKMKSDIEKIKGVTIKLSPMNPDDRLSDYRAAKLQFTISDWSADYPDVHTYADSFARTDGPATHRVKYANPKCDELLDQGITEQDPAKRKQIYIDLQKILIEDVPFISQFQPIYRSPASVNVTGAQPHATYILDLRHAKKTQ
jgi:peptide/nickel transport system substrate-binding protein